MDEFVAVGSFDASPPAGAALALTERVLRELRLGFEAEEKEAIDTARSLLELAEGTSRGRSNEDFGARAARDELLSALTLRALAGRLRFQVRSVAPLGELRDFDVPKLAPLPPPPPESGLHSFEVRVVDEIGRAIAGVEAEFIVDTAQTVTTNAGGVALLEEVSRASASVAIADVEALSEVLDSRWEKFRPGKPPREANTQTVVFRREELGPFALKAEVPNTIVIKPPLAKLFLELWDKTGRFRHASSPFEITGPQSFSGTTDEDGLIQIDGVMQGDYSLALTIESFKGDPDETIDVVETPIVALAPDVAEPQRRLLGAIPISILARLRMAFNTNKAFLLPTALTSMQKLRRLYTENAPCKLLVVGHADTKGGAAFNDKLSLSRAKATLAYLKDDVDAWLEFYNLSDPKQVWGKLEDHLMLLSLPDVVAKQPKESEIFWFQRTRGLKVDGIAGPKTRTALIREYMSLDGTSLADFVGEIEAQAHGCGENFPLDASELELAAAPEAQKRDPGDRRVELFFFDPEFGISPKPPSENSKAGSGEYPKWRERVRSIVDLRANDPDAPLVTFVEVTDAHFRLNSAVMLPEGEDPESDGDHQALTSVGLIATALRFNDDHAGRTLLVAGHTDTSADIPFNQKLSEERAEVALSLLKGGDASRERFKTLCDARHTVADIKQILSWVAASFEGFDCDPGVIDDRADDVPVRKFQAAYNANKSTLNPDPNVAPLKVDGSVGELTWGAFFDCYEAALREELGEDASGVAALREKLRFVHEEHEFLGFSEHFPIEELGVDNFRSQTNRRVELLFFEHGEEPDVEFAAKQPDLSELYLPGRYERMPIPPMGSARRREMVVNVVDHLGFPVENQEVTLFLPNQETMKVSTDAQGTLTAKVPFGVVAMLLADGRFLHFGEQYNDYKHDPVTELEEFPSDSDGARPGTGTQEMTIEDLNDSMSLLSSFDDDLAPLP